MSTREPGSNTVEKLNSGGRTPTMEAGPLFNVMLRPMMFGSEANRRCQRPCVRITASGALSFDSSSVKLRPRRGCARESSESFAKLRLQSAAPARRHRASYSCRNRRTQSKPPVPQTSCLPFRHSSNVDTREVTDDNPPVAPVFAIQTNRSDALKSSGRNSNP